MEKQKYPCIVSFELSSYEDYIHFQTVVNSEEEHNKLIEDFKDCFKRIFTEYIKESLGKEIRFMDDEISIDWEIHNVFKCLRNKGWNKPNICKTYSADLWSKIDLKQGRLKTFHNAPPDTELEKIMDNLVREIFNEVKRK